MGYYVRLDTIGETGKHKQQTLEEVLSQGPSLTGYLAPAKQADAPVILVFQEIFGVNNVMRELCDSLAGQGFTALCPDMFWRLEPGVDITDQSEEDWKKAFELYQAFDVDQGIDDIKTSIAFIKKTYGTQTPIGSVGYCLGGLLAYLAAARTRIDASVGYYGVSLDTHIREVEAIKKPLLLHMAGKDGFVDEKAQSMIREGIKSHPQITLLFYPERNHAFARQGGEHYHKADAQKAKTETLGFLKKHLA